MFSEPGALIPAAKISDRISCLVSFLPPSIFAFAAGASPIKMLSFSFAFSSFSLALHVFVDAGRRGMDGGMF